MTITLATEPTYPLPAKTAKLTFSADTGDYVRVFCSSAPTGSKYRKQLDAEGSTRVQVLEGDVGVAYDFMPDVAGVYTLVVHELSRGASTYGGGWQGDPNSYPSEEFVGETQIFFQVGSRLTMPIGVSPDTAELILFVWDATIRGTTEKSHGEISPRIDSGKSDKAKNNALATAVALRLLALAGQTSVAATGNSATTVNSIIDKFNLHIASTVFHSNADTDNAIDASFRNPSSPEGLKRSVRELLTKLERHMLNDLGSGATQGPGSASYHAPGSVKSSDWANKPIAKDTSDLATTIISLSDCWRAYYGHRTSSVHLTADNTNVASALSPLLDLHNVFLGGLTQFAPESPATANAGVVTLVSAAGMKES